MNDLKLCSVYYIPNEFTENMATLSEGSIFRDQYICAVISRASLNQHLFHLNSVVLQTCCIHQTGVSYTHMLCNAKTALLGLLSIYCYY